MSDATDRLDLFLDQLVAVFGHKDRQGPCRDYCLGLLLDGDRKSMEPMAARLAPATASRRRFCLLRRRAPGQFGWPIRLLLATIRRVCPRSPIER